MDSQGPARRRALRTGAAVLAVGLGIVLTPATAAAAPAVTPLVDCVSRDDDGTWTAVLGYENAGRSAVTIEPGSQDNRIRPAPKQAALPSRFEPGVHHGVFSVTVERGAGFEWQLADGMLPVRADSTPACPPATEMPAEGNGTGVVVALGAAGILGVAGIRRARRRPAAAAGGVRP